MYYIILIAIFLSNINGDEFDRLNSSPTQKMIESMKNAKFCDNPAKAKENFDKDFKYGCFCGKGYPDIVSTTGKNYRDLDRDEKDALIARYYAIKPIDSIDELCFKHDICYIYEGREDQLCNDTIYSELRKLSDGFYEMARGEGSDSKAMRCERLASDIGVVFKTIFGSGENLSLMRMGMFMMINTPMTVMSRGIQKASHGMNDSPLYPLAGERCRL